MPQTLALPEADALSEGAQDALAWAHPVVQEWFTAKFGSPTEPQIAGWPAILRGEPTLISAPTGSGKTLAALSLIHISSKTSSSARSRRSARPGP